MSCGNTACLADAQKDQQDEQRNLLKCSCEQHGESPFPSGDVVSNGRLNTEHANLRDATSGFGQPEAERTDHTLANKELFHWARKIE
jgi:hypothetical protein